MPIHQLAVVDERAEIHETATIGPFCVIDGPVTIGPDVELVSHVTVLGRTSIGAGSKLFSNAVVGGDPQDLKFKGEDSEVRIGERCRIHEFATVNKGTAGGGMLTSLGDECLIMAYAHIAHDCHLADHVIIGNGSQLAGHVTIAPRAIVSGMVGVHHFVTIGELAFVGAMSGVRADVPPYVMVDGRPADPVQLNLVGLRRAGWADEDLDQIKRVYRALFRDRNGTPAVEAVELCKESHPIATGSRADALCQWLLDHASTSIKGRMQEAHR